MLQDAEIQIDNPNWKYGDRPYTVQLGGCGDPGEYVHLTPNYVMNFDTDPYKFDFGPAGNSPSFYLISALVKCSYITKI